MSKKILIIITLICVIVSLAACRQTANTPSIPPPEDMSGIPGDVLIPDASDALASEPEPSEPETSETTTSPATDSAPTNTPANNTTGTTSKTPTPPASSTPSQTPAHPATSIPAPSTSSAPMPSQPSKPTYTEADYQRIIDTIRAYGETKGFVWDDSFAFGQEELGYYGRPNLERDGYDGVINRLKYHCDEMAKDIGACHFKVVKNIYQGNTEFVVLYG